MSDLLNKASDLGLGISEKSGNLVLPGHTGVITSFEDIDATAPIVLGPAVIVVLQTPTMYNETPAIGRMIKSLFESYATSISGIDIAKTLDSEQAPYGQDGQMIDIPTITKRTQQNPSFTWPELPGAIVWHLIDKWVEDISDSDTNVAMSRINNVTREFTPSAYSVTFMAIQFDATMRANNILNAALFTNVWPQGVPEFGMKRDVAAAAQVERNVTFNSIVQTNRNVLNVAKQLSIALELHKLNQDTIAAAASEIDASIADSGIQESINVALSTA